MTTSATKGKVLTARRELFTHRHATEWVKAHEADSLQGAARELILLVDSLLEARDAQQAAIHEEELREARRELAQARELLAMYHRPHTYPETHMCPACSFLGQPFLGASQQTGTPPAPPLAGKTARRLEDLDASPPGSGAPALDPVTVEACAQQCEDASTIGDFYARRIRSLTSHPEGSER